MKNWTFLLILLCSALGFCTGCQDNNKCFRIGISQCSDDVWRQQMNQEMLREGSLYKQNLQIDIRSANGNSQRQIEQIDSLVASGIDLLIVSPNEGAALTPAVEKVYKKGLPVLVVDRKIFSNQYTAFIGANNHAVGQDVGAFISSELNGHGTVVEFTGQMGSTAAQERHQGFVDALKKSPDIRLLAQVEAGWEGSEVDRQLDSLFRMGIIPDMIFAHNDRMGVKLHKAALRRGHRIKVVGIDGLASKDGGLYNVEKGELTATFIYPTSGDKVIQKALQILRKEPFERDTQLNSAIINASTARIFRIQSEQVQEGEERIDRLGSQLDQYLSRYTMQNMLLIAAIVIIVLIGIILVIGLRAYFSTIKRNQTLAHQKVKLEEQRDRLVSLSKELQESTQSKLTFFTEVSHDLRTPLTLILAPIEQLQEADNLTGQQRDLIQIIRTNADILLRLVGQTLDFRKFEAGQLQLQAETVPLIDSIQKWCAPFQSLAQKKMIRYQVNTVQQTENEPPVRVFLDPVKMESVVYNILSNAFKYTPEGGKITVDAYVTEDGERGKCLNIVIKDSGQGIDPQKISRIFDRFYQVDASHDGSGIGLATVKAYVELHQGTIRAESAPGRGSCFTITIPCETRKPLPAQPAPKAEAQPLQPTDNSSSIQPSAEAMPDEAGTTASSAIQPVATPLARPAETPAKQTEGKPTVLIIDDNEDIRSYIRILLGDSYKVEEASNGREGLTRARQLIPDAVVCDVMMPVMDGWECCRRLKDEWQTSHIPVMMLTACTLDEQRIAGFDSGADAYISKPFSPDMFRARLRNLIANRRRLQAFFGDKTTLAQADVSELDKGFAERFRALIEKHLDNPDLSVEDLAAEMGLGRSQLYRKLKSLTGYSPVELLRIARLKKAAELLTRSEKTVAEVAYEVGFSTPSYLTKCFRDYFGVSPTDYARNRS